MKKGKKSNKKEDKDNKRGLSTIIITLIILSLSLVAVGIMWVVIQDLIESESEKILLSQNYITLDLIENSLVLNPITGKVSIDIKRGYGLGDLKGIKFIISDQSNSVPTIIDTGLTESGQQKFSIPLPKEITCVQEISIAPIFQVSGKTFFGNIIDTYKQQNCVNLDGTIYTAAKPAIITKTDGECGSAEDGTFSTAPTTNLCDDGNPGSVTPIGAEWMWYCSGINGGDDVVCTAAFSSSPSPGACGSANGLTTLTSIPTIQEQLCNVGTLTNVITGIGTTADPWKWTCSGLNGGANSPQCSATKTTTYTCASPNSCKSSCLPSENPLSQYTCQSGMCCGTTTPPTGVIYYIRQGATGAGTDWTNAYGALPTPLIRGATYYIADGTYGSYTFDDVVSGTQYITIKKATTTEHGTDTGWLTSYGDGQALFTSTSASILSFSNNYFIFDGVTGSGKTGYGFKITTTACTSASKIVSISNANYITISHTEMQHCGMSNTYNQDIFYIIGSSGGTSHLTISNNYLHDVNRVHVYANYMTNSIFEYNFMEYRDAAEGGPHGEAMSINFCGLDSNNIIRNNIFKDISGTGYVVIKDSVQSGFDIYGNVFYATDPKYYATNGVITDTTGDSATDVKVYNNVFFNIPGASVGTTSYPVSWDVSTGNEFINNICFGCNAPVGVESRSHNLYDNNALASQETNSQYWSGGNSLFVNSVGGDFRLTQATTAGKTLASLYNVDMLGNIRGSDGVWDRGVYEYGGTAKPPVCTTNCPSIGVAQCSGTSDYQTCEDKGGGCLQWSTATNCPTGQTCSSGVCSTPALKANGATCTLGTECISTFCYVDADNDGYAPASGTKTCKATAPAGIGIDCCDSDARARNSISIYYSTPNNCGNYDYNCDSITTKQYSTCQYITSCNKVSGCSYCGDAPYMSCQYSGLTTDSNCGQSVSQGYCNIAYRPTSGLCSTIASSTLGIGSTNPTSMCDGTLSSGIISCTLTSGGTTTTCSCR